MHLPMLSHAREKQTLIENIENSERELFQRISLLKGALFKDKKAE